MVDRVDHRLNLDLLVCIFEMSRKREDFDVAVKQQYDWAVGTGQQQK